MYRRCTSTLMLLVTATAARAQDADTIPPMIAGEYVAKAASGCRMVFRLPANPAPDFVATQQKAIPASAWQGPCQYGLATGRWTLRTGEYNYAYGRQLTKRIVERYGGWHHKGIVYRLGDTAVSIPDWDDPYAAKWNAQVGGESALEGTTHIVRVFESTCGAYPGVFKDCGTSEATRYDVYAVKIGHRTDSRTSATVWGKTDNDSLFWCPNPRTTAGCTALWHEKAAPVVADIARFIARAAASDSQLVRALAQSNAQWVAAHPGPVAASSASAVSPAPAAPRGPARVVPTFFEAGARVTTLDGPAPSRASCVRVSWIESYRSGVADLDRGAFMNPYRQLRNQRALIATNECGEPVWITALVCTEDRMTEPSTTNFLRQSPSSRPWSIGAMRGIRLEYNSQSRNASAVAPGLSTYLATTKDHVRRPQDSRDFVFESQEKLVHVLYGAWPLDAVWSTATNALTPAGVVIDRKRTATIAAFNVHSIFDSPGVQHGNRSYRVPDTNILRINNCAAGNLAGAWTSAR